MEITVHRTKSFIDNSYGRRTPIAVFFNGKPVGHVATGETITLNLPDVCGTLQVCLLDSRNPLNIGRFPYDDMTPSNTLELSPDQIIKEFSVRTRVWVLFDFLDLVYFKVMRQKILVLEVREHEVRIA